MIGGDYMSKKIDIEEFKKHTKHIADMVHEKNESAVEMFYLGVIEYVDRYAKVFEEDTLKS